MFSHTYNEPGTYSYFCGPHPWMTGFVIVDADMQGDEEVDSEIDEEGQDGADEDDDTGNDDE